MRLEWNLILLKPLGSGLAKFFSDSLTVFSILDLLGGRLFDIEGRHDRAIHNAFVGGVVLL